MASKRHFSSTDLKFKAPISPFVNFRRGNINLFKVVYFETTMNQFYLHFLALIFFLQPNNISASDNSPDSFPVHYPLLDSLNINYNLHHQIISFSKKELENSNLPWWEKSILYRNYFSSSIHLFFPIADIKEIWEEWFETDPHRSCGDFVSEFSRIPKMEYVNNIPFPAHCLLLREKQFFQSHCNSLYAALDSTAIKKLSKWYNGPYDDLKSKLALDSIIEKTGNYPGRSIVGIDLEHVVWAIIQNGDLRYLQKKLPLMEATVRKSDLHPMYLAMTIDKIEKLHNRPQIYGTQTQKLEDREEMYPIKDPANVDKLRAKMGLPPIDGGRASLGDIMYDRIKDK